MSNACGQRSSGGAMAAEVVLGAAAASIAVPGRIALEAVPTNCGKKVLGKPNTCLVSAHCLGYPRFPTARAISPTLLFPPRKS